MKLEEIFLGFYQKVTLMVSKKESVSNDFLIDDLSLIKFNQIYKFLISLIYR